MAQRGRPKKIAVKIEEIKTEPKAFSLSFDIGGLKENVTADSVEDGLNLLALKFPPFIKARGVFSLQQDNLKSSVLFYPLQIRKMRVNKIMRLIFAKRLTMALK